MNDEEEHLSREELVEREYQIKRREYDELQRMIDERCRAAGARWKAAHPWLAPGWCVTVPVPNLSLPI
jgi:hypothetical protein